MHARKAVHSSTRGGPRSKCRGLTTSRAGVSRHVVVDGKNAIANMFGKLSCTSIGASSVSNAIVMQHSDGQLSPIESVSSSDGKPAAVLSDFACCPGSVSPSVSSSVQQLQDTLLARGAFSVQQLLAIGAHPPMHLVIRSWLPNDATINAMIATHRIGCATGVEREVCKAVLPLCRV